MLRDGGMEQAMKAPRKVWVTGGASGLGRAISRHFALQGDSVHVFDIDAPALERLASETDGILVTPLDVGKPDALVEALAAQTDEALDVLVNCVGISGPTAAIADVTLDQWRRTFDVNLTSYFLCARHAAPLMARNRGGLIVNISSTSALTGLPFRTPYVVSKAAVIALAKNLARELGPMNIRVNAILPGPMAGERLRTIVARKAEAMGITPEAYEAEMVRFISMRTTTEPDDVAAMIGFLASDAARHITGQTISVDGNVEYEE